MEAVNRGLTVDLSADLKTFFHTINHTGPNARSSLLLTNAAEVKLLVPFISVPLSFGSWLAFKRRAI